MLFLPKYQRSYISLPSRWRYRRGLQGTEAEETGLSFSCELLIKQPILELEVTGATIFVEHPGRNQPSTNTFENHAIMNKV